MQGALNWVRQNPASQDFALAQLSGAATKIAEEHAKTALSPMPMLSWEL